jgi:hypothetical protein
MNNCGCVFWGLCVSLMLMVVWKKWVFWASCKIGMVCWFLLVNVEYFWRHCICLIVLLWNAVFLSFFMWIQLVWFLFDWLNMFEPFISFVFVSRFYFHEIFYIILYWVNIITFSKMTMWKFWILFNINFFHVNLAHSYLFWVFFFFFWHCSTICFSFSKHEWILYFPCLLRNICTT